MSKNRANELTVKLREVFGDKSKLRFSENPKITIAIVGLQSLVGGSLKFAKTGERKWLN